MMTTYRFVLTTIADGVGTLTLNRPDRLNAFDTVMSQEMVRAARALAGDPAVRVIVVTGAGRGFCAGADIKVLGAALEERNYEAAMTLVRDGGEVVHTLRRCPKPVLGSLNGAAAGGGANLALACDLRIASESASIGQVFHRIGVHPDMGGTYFLPRLLGSSRALELIWSAEMLPADHCLELGLVNRVVPADRLAAETAAWAGRLAALPPIAARLAKQAVYRADTADLATMLEIESEHQLECFRSEDATEGLAAFTNKRIPAFRGR